MKGAIYIFMAIAGLMFTSCTKSYQASVAERKAVGQYKFEKVVRHDGFLNSDNLTQEYNNMILQLNERKQAALIDQNNNITYVGKYDIVTQTVYNGDDNGSSSTEHTIIIDVSVDGSRGTQLHWVGQNARITNNKLKFSAEKPDGRYVFKLDKI